MRKCSEECIPCCDYCKYVVHEKIEFENGKVSLPLYSKARPCVVICDESEVKRDCHKCVYEVGCTGNPVGCKRYKRDAPDGGYYG